VVYARVSSVKQKRDGNLASQRDRLLEAARAQGYRAVDVFAQKASAMSEKRRGLRRLLVTDSQSSRPVWAEPEWVVLQQAGMGEMRGDRLLAADHGLSLWVRAEGAGGHGTPLLGDGPDGAGIERNMPRLGLRLGEVDDVVIRHGHFDHGQGLTAAIRMTPEESGRRVPLHLHPGMFRRAASASHPARSPRWRSCPRPTPGGSWASNRSSAGSAISPRTAFSSSAARLRAPPHTNARGLPGHVARREDGVGEDAPAGRRRALRRGARAWPRPDRLQLLLACRVS
jgi:hypothetical protein